MKLPYRMDLSDKVVAVTGAGGVLMSEFCRALAACGAKVALLDINETAAKAVADEIGENAIAVGTNCLDKASIEVRFRSTMFNVSFRMKSSSFSR